MPISLNDFQYLKDTLLRLGSVRLEDGKKDSTGLLSSKLIETMTTNETYFFRDVHPFDALKNKILPDLIKQRSAQRTLRIWCAACSTGQEPYSVAMLIQENFPELTAWNVEILGTDLCTEMLAKAEKAGFTSFETARGLSELLQDRYFESKGKERILRDSIR